jgi:hypothetical protein
MRVESLAPKDPGSGLQRFRRAWCSVMHDNLSWPLHGKYICRRCGTVFIVPWRAKSQTEDKP